MKIYICLNCCEKKSSLSRSVATFMYFFFFINVLSYYLTNTTISFLFKSLHSFFRKTYASCFQNWKMSFVPPSLQKIIDLRMISIDAEKMCIIFVLQYLFFICKWWSIKLCKMANYPFSGNKNHTDTFLSFSELCLLPLWIADKLTNMLL